MTHSFLLMTFFIFSLTFYRALVLDTLELLTAIVGTHDKKEEAAEVS